MTKRKPKPLHFKRGDSASKRSRQTLNADGWMNIFTGQGISNVDKQTGTSFGSVKILTEGVLTNIYRGDGFGRRVIDLPTGEMLRAGWQIHGDTDGDINKYLRNLKAKQKILLALRWARLYGGALIVMHINDGQFADTPIREEGIRDIEALHVYSRYRVTWTSTDLYTDYNSPKFGQVEFYTINPVGIGVIQPFKVHESRCLFFDGLPVDDMTRHENQGWGDSILQVIFTQLSDLAGVYHSSRNIIDDFIQTIIKINNLHEMLRAGEEDLVRKRVQILDLSRATMNTLMLDKEEDYEKSASSVAGLADLLQKHAEAFSAVTDIPITLLLGQSANGFNSKDDGSMQKWYDKIAQKQDDELSYQLERLIYICMLAKKGPTKGKVIEDWSLEFNKLFQLTDAEIVELRNKQAETDKIYIEQSVLSPEGVSISRFGGDEYSLDTHIELSDLSDQIDPEDKDDID